MGKRGPKADPHREPIFVTAFSARRDCVETLERLRVADKKKHTRGAVICAALQLAERYPGEMRTLIEGES